VVSAVYAWSTEDGGASEGYRRVPAGSWTVTVEDGRFGGAWVEVVVHRRRILVCRRRWVSVAPTALERDGDGDIADEGI
jgi:hypothetical protein